MKREIKFRARITGTDNWIVGYPHRVYSENVIDSIQDIENRKVEYIDIETLGQFVGLKDKNGVDIYYGDIYTQGDKNIKYKVIFKDGCFIGNQIGNKSLVGLSHFIKDIQVIGNIHENPELIN